MKRVFRVASVFTGAAACAAVAVPAAQAATLAPEAVGKVTPLTTGASCGSPFGHPTQDFVLYYTGNPPVHHAACFVGTGGASAVVGGNPAFATYCDYQNTGYVWIGGTRRNIATGTHNLGGQHVSKVLLTGTTTPAIICTTN